MLLDYVDGHFAVSMAHIGPIQDQTADSSSMAEVLSHEQHAKKYPSMPQSDSTRPWELGPNQLRILN